MNRTVLAALFLDAFQQVVDNRVFRLLLGLVALAVAATFAIGIEDDGLRVFWIPFAWSDLGVSLPTLPGRAREDFIAAVQDGFVTRGLGLLAPLVCVAATAFFVPRMLERGAADTLFSKPVSRTALLLVRYSAGLLFVALLSVLLVGGMHLGFWVRSGYADAGFLWAAPMLVYRYAILHAVSVLAGAWTRSSTAALLAAVMFAGANGTLHFVAETREAFLVERDQARARAEQRAAEGRSSRSRAPRVVEPDRPGPTQTLVIGALDALHVVLPKPGDAPELVDLLRASGDETRKSNAATGLSWSGPARHNAFVSLASSLGFVVVCLVIAAWRVRRMRF